MNTQAPERETALPRSPGTRPLRRVFLALCWIAGLHLLLQATAAAQGICDRTPQVRDEILITVGIESRRAGETAPEDCAEVTTAHLARVRSLWLGNADITALQENDFSGLVSLQSIVLTENFLTELPEGIFRGLSSLNELFLHYNSLSALPEGIFQGLGDLTFLVLEDNSLTALPEGVFRGLDNLEYLDMSGNSISALPEGVFRGLGKLEVLDLWGNPFKELPEGVFQGLDSLERLYLNRNHLQELPERLFRALDSLRILWLTSNSLIRLPPGIFRGLDSIDGLYLSRNSLSELPKDVFQGLDTLKSLTFFTNILQNLPPGIFDGLDSLSYLNMNSNPIQELPEGIFDDVLDTLGSEYDFAGIAILTGRLSVPSHLKAGLAFDSPGQQASEGATVRVGVTLSRAAPVTVRVPYTVGIGGALSGLGGLSPPPDRGLLFTAGEMRREIVFTLPEEAGTQGTRTVVLTLGTPPEIGLRRSDGGGPDAPYLDSESLILRPGEGAVHTVTVSDSDPEERETFCLSLWGGKPCSAAAVLPHAVVGPLGESVARTELVLTNRAPREGACEAAVLFDRGTGPAGAVSFDGRFPEGNLLRTTIPRGGAEVLTLEAPGGEVSRTGAVHVFTRSPCTASSLKVQGRILTENPGSGEVEEMVSLPAQSPQDWLGDGDCRVLTGVFGNGRDVVLAAVTTQPDHPAPPGTSLGLHAFDLTGKFLRPLPGLEISGAQQVLSMGRWNQPLIIEACLNVPGTGSPFRLAATAIGSKASGSGVQYGVESLAGGAGP